MAEWKEGLWMRAEERDRLKVLHEVKKRHITQKQAAAELGLSVRWCANCWYAGKRVGIAHSDMGCVGETPTGKRRRR